MNLTELFKMQAEFDAHIVEKKGLQGQGLLDKKILALQAELGELANEWRGFKFWSEYQEPNTKVMDLGKLAWRNPLLEEYVDCLHFILSIGNEIGLDKLLLDYKARERDISKLFIQINLGAGTLAHYQSDHIMNYQVLVGQFIMLGYQLGFTDEQVIAAYKEKHKVNYARQENGY